MPDSIAVKPIVVSSVSAFFLQRVVFLLRAIFSSIGVSPCKACLGALLAIFLTVNSELRAQQSTEEPATRPQISWQLLQPEDLDDSDSLLARHDAHDFPFASDSPFHNRQFQLEPEQSVFVMLPANHWFYLEFTDDHEEQEPPPELTALISLTPGLAQKTVWQEKQNLLPPSNRQRVIKITYPRVTYPSNHNTIQKDKVQKDKEPETLAFYLATGRRIDNQTFAPLSWMQPKEQSEEQPEQSAQSQSRRIYRSDNQDNDFYQQTDLLKQDSWQKLEFALEKDKTYWLEGVQASAESWPQTQAQQWTWQERTADTSLNREHSQFLFARTSRQQLVSRENLFDGDGLFSAYNSESGASGDRHNASGDREDAFGNRHNRQAKAPAHINAMRSGIYQPDRDMNTELLLDKQGFVRLQSTDEDWLFASNYQDYGEPAIEQKRQQSDFSQQLHRQVVTSISSQHAIQKQPTTITDPTTAATLDSWLSWRDLPPQAHSPKVNSSGKSGIQQRAIMSKIASWHFAKEHAPDLSHDNISLSNFPQKQSFSEITPEHSLTWTRSDDAVNNQLQLQITQTASPMSGSYIIKVDGNVFAELLHFDPPHFYPLQVQDYSQDPHWQIGSRKPNWQNDGAESQQLNAHIDTHNHALLAGSHVFELPANWQKLELIAKDAPALVRLRYRTTRYPKLDAPQWHTWLAHNKNYSQVERTLTDGAMQESPGKEYPLISHPHWLHFQHYLKVKQQQFSADKELSFWQTLITTGKTPEGVFDLAFPGGMSGYQRLQENLLTPRINSWPFWQQVLQDLRSAGWRTYANDLSTTLVQLHPNADIVVKASEDYFYQLSQSHSDAQQVSLLSYVIFVRHLPEDSQNRMKLSLANLFQQQNRHDYGLFVLGLTPDTPHRRQLIYNMARHEGYLSLAEHFKPQPDKTPDLLNNKTQQLSLDSITQINAAKGVQLFNPELQVRQSNVLVTSDTPLTIAVSGPTELEFEARLWFAHTDVKTATSHHWLTLDYDNQKQLVPVFNNAYRSEGLQHPEAEVGAAHRFKVFIPGKGALTLQTEHHSMSVNVKEVSNNLQETTQEAYCYRDNTWLPQDYYSWTGIWQAREEDDNDKRAPSENHGDEASQFNCALHVQKGVASNASQDFSVVEANDALSSSRTVSAYQNFLRLLKDFEASPDNATLTILNRTLDSWADSNQKHRLLRRVNLNASWQAQNNPMRAKKFSAFEANTNAPLTPAGYRGRLLYTPFEPEWEKLSDSSALNYELAISDSQEYRLRLLSQKHLFINQSRVEVEIAINDRFHDVVVLTMGQEQSLALPFSAGTQSLNLRLNNAKGPVSVLAQLQFNEQVDGTKVWKNQPQTVRLKLFQADQQQPLQQFFPQPSWLRIDSFTRDGINKQEFVLAEKGIFSWHPEETDPEVIGHRLYHLQLLPDNSKELKQRRTAKITDDDVSHGKTKILTLNLYPSGEPYQAAQPQNTTEDFPDFALLQSKPVMEEQHFVDRPWGVALSQQQRRTPAEDAAQNNRFWQLQVYSQSADAQRRYFSRYDLAARLYSSDLSPSIHASYQWWDTDWWQNWDLNVGLSIAAQQGFRDEGLGWSGRLHVQAQKQYSLNRRWFNRFDVSLWGNLINAGKDTQQFATAVYSQYKLDHRYGIQLSDTLRYKWHHDFESWAQLTLNTNPLSQSDLIDNGIAVLGTRIFYQGLAADIRWRYQSFLADRNRAAKSKDSRLSVALEWFGWEQDTHYRIRLGYDRNLIADENYWFMGLSWNESGSRGVHDYMPQSLAFANLRQQQFVNTALEDHPTEDQFQQEQLREENQMANEGGH